MIIMPPSGITIVHRGGNGAVRCSSTLKTKPESGNINGSVQ